MNSVKERNKQLESRLLDFSKRIIDLAAKISPSPLRNQLIRAGTSPGSNYIEACEAESSRDFVHKIAICRKEMRETVYWLRLISYSHPGLKEECLGLEEEAGELIRIFSSISGKFKR